MVSAVENKATLPTHEVLRDILSFGENIVFLKHSYNLQYNFLHSIFMSKFPFTASHSTFL